MPKTRTSSKSFKKILLPAAAALLMITLITPTAVDAGDLPVFENPLQAETASGILETITRWLVGFAVSLALLALVTGGIMYIISFGDENRTRRAKAIIFWAVVGLVVMLLAFAVIVTVANLLGAPTSAPSAGNPAPGS